jgi:hypothetical protein
MAIMHTIRPFAGVRKNVAIVQMSSALGRATDPMFGMARRPSFVHHDWVQTLRTKGLRATAQGVTVLDFLYHHPNTGAEAIFQAVSPFMPTISLQAIH